MHGAPVPIDRAKPTPAGERGASRCVVALGEAIVDRLGDAREPGGAPANVAAGLAKLGTQAAFVGAIADDDAGACVRTALERAGVDVRACRLLPATERIATRTAIVENDADGERRFVGFEPPQACFADTQLRPVDVYPAVDCARAIVLGTLGFAVRPTRDALTTALRRATERAIPVVLDINRRDVFWPEPAIARDAILALAMPSATILKASRDEALWLFDTEDPVAIARRFRGLRNVVVTDGANGARWCARIERRAYTAGVTAAFAIRSLDATGAGDAFLAAFVHASLSGDAPAEAMRFGAAAGAIVASARGAMAPQPTHAEIDRFLAST